MNNLTALFMIRNKMAKSGIPCLLHTTYFRIRANVTGKMESGA